MTCTDSGEKATIAGFPTSQRRSAGCHGANATIGAGVSTTSRVPDGSDVTALTLPGKTFHSGGQTSSGPKTWTAPAGSVTVTISPAATVARRGVRVRSDGPRVVSATTACSLLMQTTCAGRIVSIPSNNATW